MTNEVFAFDAFVYCFVATIIYCDNQETQALTRNFTFYVRNKHIDIQHHFVKNKVQDNTLELRYVVSNNQIADDLIKPLFKDKFLKFRRDIDFY